MRVLGLQRSQSLLVCLGCLRLVLFLVLSGLFDLFFLFFYYFFFSGKDGPLKGFEISNL